MATSRASSHANVGYCEAYESLLLTLWNSVRVRPGHSAVTCTPVPLAMGHANVIWQGDANAWTLRALARADASCPILNVTGPETVPVRWVAGEFARRFGRDVTFAGQEAPDALLSNAARAFATFGYPGVPLARMLDWVADWTAAGGRSLGKATKFEVRDGIF